MQPAERCSGEEGVGAMHHHGGVKNRNAGACTSSAVLSSTLGGPDAFSRYDTMPAASRGPPYSLGESTLPFLKICRVIGRAFMSASKALRSVSSQRRSQALGTTHFVDSNPEDGRKMPSTRTLSVGKPCTPYLEDRPLFSSSVASTWAQHLT